MKIIFNMVGIRGHCHKAKGYHSLTQANGTRAFFSTARAGPLKNVVAITRPPKMDVSVPELCGS